VLPSSMALLVMTHNHGEAQMVRQLLACYGIPCQVVSTVPQVLPIFPWQGEARVLVAASELREARCFLADHLRHGLQVLSGGVE